MNEVDSFAVAWLRALYPTALVDSRSIKYVEPADTTGFVRCHFFAGIAGWEYALQLAGWPEEREVWTGSCPCQPFSAAGKQRGTADERHLWPEWFRLIEQCRPQTIFGEQVASTLAVGRSAGSQKKMQEVLDRAAVFGVLRQLQGQSTLGLQNVLQEGLAKGQAVSALASLCGVQEMAKGQPWPCTCKRGEEPREEAGDGVRSDSGKHPKPNRRRGVRANRDSVRSQPAAGVERSVTGQDRLGSGLHDGQREGGSVCPKCHGQYMGSGEDFGDCVGDYEATSGSIEQPLAINWGCPETEFESSWIARVRTDLERAGYRFGICVLPAACVGAPHIRQRLFWVADAQLQRAGIGEPGSEGCSRIGRDRPAIDGEARRLGHASASRQPLPEPRDVRGTGRREEGRAVEQHGLALDGVEHATCGGTRATEQPGCVSSSESTGQDVDRLGDTPRIGRGEERQNSRGSGKGSGAQGIDQRPWDNFDVIPCRDGKTRRVEPGVCPLATGVSGRVGRLRGYGNAIVPQVAATFIQAYLEAQAATSTPEPHVTKERA